MKGQKVKKNIRIDCQQRSWKSEIFLCRNIEFNLRMTREERKGIFILKVLSYPR